MSPLVVYNSHITKSRVDVINGRIDTPLATSNYYTLIEIFSSPDFKLDMISCVNL